MQLSSSTKSAPSMERAPPAPPAQQPQQRSQRGLASAKKTGSGAPANPVLSRSSPFVSAAGPDSPSLVQCARRRLQYSQLPVRCPGKKSQSQLVGSLNRFPVIGSPKRSVSAKSCTEPSTSRQQQASPGSPNSKQKCMSLIDLSLARKRSSDFGSLAELRDVGSSSARLEDKDERRVSPLVSRRSRLPRDERAVREAQAAGLVCRVLVVHAWRRRRLEVIELRTALAEVGQQAEQLQLQIRVLRSLIDKDNARVQNLAGELHRVKAQLDETIRERDQLNLEKQAMEMEALKERQSAEERAASVESLRGELREAKAKLDALEDQMSKDREKLEALKEEKLSLMDKLAASEALTEERSARAAKAEQTLEERQLQLSKQLALTSALQDEIQRRTNLLREREAQRLELEETILRLEKENMTLDERLRISEETEGSLNSKTACLENQLLHQENKLRRLEAEYSTQLLEFNELRDRFIRQSEECGWSGKLLQVVGSVSHLPRAILRTLSFFSMYFKVD